MRLLSFFVFVFALSYAFAGKIWKIEPGANSLKVFSVNTSARSAALAGSGIVMPLGSAEFLRNPLAWESGSAINFSKVSFSDRIGADFMALSAHYPMNEFHFNTSLEVLSYDDIEGRTDDGSPAGSFGAGTYSLQFGLGWEFGKLSAGLSARYAEQHIDNYGIYGFMFNGGLAFEFSEHFKFGAVFSNLGVASSHFSGNKAKEREVPPFSLQSGIALSKDLFYGFKGSLFADLYRRNDSDKEWMLGTELNNSVIAFRLGYSGVLSGGLALNLGRVEVEYGFANNENLNGNHLFGVSLKF